MGFLERIFGGGKERGTGHEIVPAVPQYFQKYSNPVRAYEAFTQMAPKAQEAFAKNAGVALKELFKNPDFAANVGVGVNNLMTSQGKAIEERAKGEREATVITAHNAPQLLEKGRFTDDQFDGILDQADRFTQQGLEAGERALTQGAGTIRDLIKNAPRKTTVIEEVESYAHARPKRGQSELSSIKRKKVIEEPQLPKHASAGRVRVAPNIVARSGAHFEVNGAAEVNHNPDGSFRLGGHSNHGISGSSAQSIQIGGNIEIDGFEIDY